MFQWSLTSFSSWYQSKRVHDVWRCIKRSTQGVVCSLSSLYNGVNAPTALKVNSSAQQRSLEIEHKVSQKHIAVVFYDTEAQGIYEYLKQKHKEYNIDIFLLIPPGSVQKPEKINTTKHVYLSVFKYYDWNSQHENAV